MLMLKFNVARNGSVRISCQVFLRDGSSCLKKEDEKSGKSFPVGFIYTDFTDQTSFSYPESSLSQSQKDYPGTWFSDYKS